MPVIAALILLFDQVTKHLVSARLEEGQTWDLAPWLTPIFRITLVTNTGAAFGLFQNWSDVFVVVSSIVIVAILIYYRHLPDGYPLMRVALGLQLGGAAGNLVDRLRQGFVVDFIDLSFWPMHNWPVSNVSDLSITSGVILLVVVLLWEERSERKQAQVSEGDA